MSLTNTSTTTTTTIQKKTNNKPSGMEPEEMLWNNVNNLI